MFTLDIPIEKLSSEEFDEFEDVILNVPTLNLHPFGKFIAKGANFKSEINIVSRFVSNLRSLYVISENNLAIEIPISNVRFDKLSIKFDGIKEEMFADTVDEKNVIMIVMYIFRWFIFTSFIKFN
tara:strand:- start:272 stop:646 length:375 start_codon:yes stop_codon:yes gene_type:complete